MSQPQPKSSAPVPQELDAAGETPAGELPPNPAPPAGATTDGDARRMQAALWVLRELREWDLDRTEITLTQRIPGAGGVTRRATIKKIIQETEALL